MPARPPGSARGPGRRVPEEHPVLPQPDQQGGPVSRQPMRQPGRVITGPGVEDEQRHPAAGAQPGRHVTDLSHGRGGRVLLRADPAAAQRPGPRIPGEAQLADLLITPARHHRLASRLPGRVIIQAPPRRGPRRAPRPGRGIHREHQRPPVRAEGSQQILQRARAGPAPGQRGVLAAMPAAHHRLQRQPRQRRHRPARAQHRISQLEQRVRPPPQAPIPPRPEPRQPLRSRG